MSEDKKEEMLYSQTQIASNLKISQSTVTRLLKKNGLRPVKIKGKAKLYSKDQIVMLNLSILQQKEISKLQNENERLEKNYSEQLKEKDKQINDLNERLEESHKLQLGLEQKLKMLGNARDKRYLNYHSGTLDQYFFRVMILPTCGE